jgi:hypothetical protein
MFCHPNAAQNHNIKMGNSQICFQKEIRGTLNLGMLVTIQFKIQYFDYPFLIQKCKD